MWIYINVQKVMNEFDARGEDDLDRTSSTTIVMECTE